MAKINMKEWAKNLTQPGSKLMPVLSFPGTQLVGVTVHEMATNPAVQAKVLCAVADKVPTVASVSAMDLSVEAEAFGAQVVFTEDEVPTITGALITTEEEAEELRVPEVGDARTGNYVEAIRIAKETITDRPVLAGVIGPYSLAGRLLDVTEIMYALYDEPDMVHIVLDKATQFLIKYIEAYKAVGANGVVIAEPLAGLLSGKLAMEFSSEYCKRIVDAVQTDDFIVIYHNCGNTAVNIAKEIAYVGAAAYHFGNAVDMEDVLNAMPADCICMGNIDPAGIFAGGTPEEMRKAVYDLLDKVGDRPNFALSSGCDIPPHAKWDNIVEFFQASEDYWKAK